MIFSIRPKFIPTTIKRESSQREKIPPYTIHQSKHLELVVLQRIIFDRTKRKEYLNKIITRHRMIALYLYIKANI